MNQPFGLTTGGTPVPPKKAGDPPEWAKSVKKCPGSFRGRGNDGGRESTSNQGEIRIRRRHAFTLIELLVVLAIVALLVAVLMPALSKARHQARVIKCMTQMKQTYLGMELYYADHGDPKWTIPARPWDISQNWTLTPPRPWELHHRYAPSSSPSPSGFGFLVRGNYLGNGDVLYCPDVTERARQAAYSPIIRNGEVESAAYYKLGGSKGKTTFLYRLTVNHDGKHFRATSHTTSYNNTNYQWTMREQNARRKKFIFSDLGLSDYGGMYSHGKQVLNATYFDGSIVSVKNAYSNGCALIPTVVDAAYGGHQ